MDEILFVGGDLVTPSQMKRILNVIAALLWLVGPAVASRSSIGGEARDLFASRIE